MTALSIDPALALAIPMLSILLMSVSIWLAPRFIARLPADWFVRESEPLKAHGLHWALHLLRNLLALLMLLLGLLMLVTPGPGLLMLLLALLIARFPGRDALMRLAIGHPRVIDMLDRLRERQAQPPFIRPGSVRADSTLRNKVKP